MKTYHLAIDLGATSGRTILASYNGNNVEMEELTRFRHPMLPIAGHLYWNLPELYHQILIGLRTASQRTQQLGGELKSIGIDTWGCDMAYFYSDGSIAGLPFCYRDSHTDGVIDRFDKKIPKHDLYMRTGTQLLNFNTVFQLFTVKQNNPTLIDAANKILFMPDALAYMLTGNAVAEYTEASTSQFVNPYTKQFDEELLSLAGVDAHKLGTMTHPGAVIGTITDDVKQFTGLGDVPVVAVGSHDTASAILAIPSPDPDFAYLSCGTWSLFGVESPTPIIGEQSLKYSFSNEGGVGGMTLFHKNIIGLWIFEQCREEWPDAPADVAQLVALCEQSTCNSIINPDDASFAHPKSMTTAINEYCIAHSQPTPQSIADYVRVIFRSLANCYAENLQQLREITGKDIKRIQVIGGGSRNQYLMQYTADAVKIPVVAGPAESTALGNVLVQMQAAGIVNTIQEMKQIAINSTSTITYQPQM